MFRSLIVQSRQILKCSTPSRGLCAQLLPETNAINKTYPQHIEDIVNKISSLTILEVADLNDLLKKRLNIESSQMMMPMSSVATPAVEKEEVPIVVAKTTFNVKLVAFDAAKKVPILKEIKLILPEMNLVQAKKFVESCPIYIKKEAEKDDAEKIKAACEAVGASVELE